MRETSEIEPFYALGGIGSFSACQRFLPAMLLPLVQTGLS
jgi:hypothetical protein